MIQTGKLGSAVSPLLWALALAALLLSASLSATGATSAHAAGQPANDGGIVIFDECVVLSVTVLDSDADFTSVFWRFGPDGDLGITSKQVGEAAVIGEVPANTEVVLGIVVQDTGNTFKTGPGSRNSDTDGLVHALVSDTPSVNGTIVGFEDLASYEPNSDFDYNDAELRLSTQPCQPPAPVTLTVQVDPASTGSGGVAGGGSYPLGANAMAAATPAAGSTFGGWSGDCSGLVANTNVVMNGNKLCIALFLAAPVEPTPEPTAVPTAEPTAVPLASNAGVDNTLVSLNPARVGETVTFRVDVVLDVPAENTADVQYTFDDSELGYLGASWNGFALNQCVLSGAGVIDCGFGVVSAGFSFDLNFEALKVADDSTTGASLSSDPDGAGAQAPIVAGPALADVDIIAITGAVPDTGDGSVASSGGTVSLQLIALLGTAVLATVGGAVRLRSGARS